MRDDQVHLGYIAEGITAIDRYLAGSAGSLDQELFFGNEIVRDAVMHRNLLAHAYATVGPERVWLLIQQRLPALRELVDREMEG